MFDCIIPLKSWTQPFLFLIAYVSFVCIFGSSCCFKLGLVNKNLWRCSFLSCSFSCNSQGRRGDFLAQPGEQRSSFSERQSMACRDKMSCRSNYCRADTETPEAEAWKTATSCSAPKNSGQTGETFFNDLQEMWVLKCQKNDTLNSRVPHRLISWPKS